MGHLEMILCIFFILMNVLVMISHIHIYVCLYEMCFDKWFHAVHVSRFSSPSGQARGRDKLFWYQSNGLGDSMN